MNVVWRFFDTNDVRNWIRVRTAVDLNVIQIAAGVCEQDDFECAIGVCELEIRLEERDMAGRLCGDVRGGSWTSGGITTAKLLQPQSQKSVNEACWK